MPGVWLVTWLKPPTELHAEGSRSDPSPSSPQSITKHHHHDNNSNNFHTIHKPFA